MHGYSYGVRKNFLSECFFATNFAACGVYNYTKFSLEVRKARVIYADTLLLVNFSMDFLAIYITVKLKNGVVRPMRMALAAAIGAVWALVVVLFEAYVANIFGQILMLFAHIVCAVVMISVAEGKRTPSIWQAVTFVAVNVSLGGAMTALYSLVGKMLDTSILQNVTNDAASTAVFIIAAAIGGVASLAYGKFRMRSLCQKKLKMTLTAFGDTISFDAMCDSGNLLREPFSGKPVVVLSAKRMEGRLPAKLIEAARDPMNMINLKIEGARLIPTSTVTGSGMMLCFTPERICVEERQIDAVAALDVNSEDYSGCDGIIGQILLNV